MRRTALAFAALASLAAACRTGSAPPGPGTAPISRPAVAAPAPRPSFAELTPLDAAPLRFDLTPAALTAECQAAEKAADAGYAALVGQPDPARTYDGTVLAYEEISAEYAARVTRLLFLKQVHPDAAVRAAAAACEEAAAKYGVRVSARKDLYLAFKAYMAGRGQEDHLDAEDAALLDWITRQFRRSGLELSDADREKLVGMRSRIAELETRFNTRLDEDRSQIEVTQAELAGLPAGYIARLARTNDGKLIVTTQYPDYFPLMENAESAAVRKRMLVAYDNRGMPENLPLLTEAVSLRRDAAQLLGYPNHVAFVTELRMARDYPAVRAFEDRLREALRGRLAAETARMTALKIADTKDRRARLEASDWRYYQNRIKKRDYDLDDEEVRRYFPVDKVMSGMFQVFQTVLGVRFDEAAVPVWAEGVKAYQVHDAGTGRLLARFYIDLYPRPGKYGHAAEFPLQSARALPPREGRPQPPSAPFGRGPSGWFYQIPMAALVVNFNPPAQGRPSYLSMTEVETLFHEFGHLMHESLTTARYASLGGTSVALDFVEAPSQMLENWVYRPEILALISRDPGDPARPMPAALAGRLAAARSFDAGLKYSRQVFLGTFDLDLHSADGTIDPDAIARRDWQEIIGYPLPPDDHFPAGFGHMMGGYDGAYYGYLWSEVFAADMFTRFQVAGILSPDVGLAYRQTILAKGRTEPPDQLLREFLGRAPNEAAFLTLTGIAPAPDKT